MRFTGAQPRWRYRANAARRAEESPISPVATLRRSSTLQELVSVAELDACRRCELWKGATHGVPGEGPGDAKLILVGEQPGDQEDLTGRPFVGPAGKLLDALLEATGLEREKILVTNAVKHFKWEPRGKRRLHARPNVPEIKACQLWLAREIEAVQPLVIVALGTTAARALRGSPGSIERLRGQTLSHACGARLIVTYHPSAVLRADDRAVRLRQALEQDLRRAADALGELLSAPPMRALQ
jgi:uracil-DNA glycosylase